MRRAILQAGGQSDGARLLRRALIVLHAQQRVLACRARRRLHEAVARRIICAGKRRESRTPSQDAQGRHMWRMRSRRSAELTLPADKACLQAEMLCMACQWPPRAVWGVLRGTC